jgi:hypothetical protein
VPIREVVSQISPPIRILLVLAVAVLGVYMMFLRPKTEEVPPVDATSSVSVAVDKTEETATAPAKENGSAKAGAAAGAKEDLKGLPKPVRQAIRKDKTLVLLFWNPKASDDQAVRAALREVDRKDGRVFVHAAPLKRISRYGRIARGVSVEQSPTVVIADRDLRADTLVGYVDTRTIDQAVTDALQNSTGLLTSSYLRSVDKLCVQTFNGVAATPDFYGNRGVKKFDARVNAIEARYVRFAGDFAAIKAPKKYAGFRRATIADLNAINGHTATFAAAVTPSSSRASVTAAQATYASAAGPPSRAMAKRFDSQGLLRCGTQL